VPHNYEWILKHPNKISDINELIRILRTLRGNNADFEFYDPYEFALKNFPNEFIENLKACAEKIILFVKNNHPIVIHGDYDVDGQTATSILWRTIYNDLKYKNVFPYVPNRFDEGYGLSVESINGMNDLLKDFPSQPKLIVTVDCGIVSIDEVEIAKKFGYDVIITDHHHHKKELPSTLCVWTDQATGAGISWLISQTVLRQSGINSPSKYSSLGATGTICDLQPLLGFNRNLSILGLQELNNNPFAGIDAIKKISAINESLDTYSIGWKIGPRLNATGRLESALDSIRILCTDSVDQADKLAFNLNSLNEQRQNKTVYGLEQAINFLDAQKDMENLPKFILVHSENFHEGVIGLIAGKLVQKFYRPSIVMAMDKKTGLAKGSARSIEGVSIIESMRKFEHLFEKSGGHDMAAGFTIKIENISLLKDSLNNLDEWSPDVFIPKIKIDSEIESSLISKNCYEKINELKPFGVGNHEPIFEIKNMSVFNTQKFGKENQHLKLFLSGQNNSRITGLVFNSNLQTPNTGQLIDIAASLSANTWNGNTSIELNIKDFKPSSSDLDLNTPKHHGVDISECACPLT
jgi:single-stranded-DNA-specific exonuclease